MSGSSEQLQVSTLSVVPFEEWLASTLSGLRSAHLGDTAATRSLPRFQRDAAVRILDLLDHCRGALLADEVGLGKTHVAAAVLRSRIERWGPVLVVAPVSVIPQWRRLLGDLGSAVRFTSFQMLSLGRLPQPHPFGLVVIDEAQHLRNSGTKRYDMVCRLSTRARLLLVSATPIHNSPSDIYNLLRLFLPWQTLARTNSLERLRSVLRLVMVRRTRWTITQVYQEDGWIRTFPGAHLPSRSHRTVSVTLSPGMQEIADRLAALVQAAFPGKEENPPTALLLLMLYRRLASSPAAYLCTLRRWSNYLTRQAEAHRVGHNLDRHRFLSLFGNDPDGQLAQLVLPFFFDDPQPSDNPETPDMVIDRAEALALLDEAIRTAKGLLPAMDHKLAALVDLLDREKKKTVIMTTYQDTARYLYRNLPHPDLLLLTGSGALSRRAGRLGRMDALRRFAPHGQGLPAGLLQEETNTLIATDLLSEGVNLQDASRLIHYDLPYDPMVLEQRCGRLDRLSSSHSNVEAVTFGMPEILEVEIGIERLLHRKRALKVQLLDRVGYRDLSTLRDEQKPSVRNDSQVQWDRDDRLDRSHAPGHMDLFKNGRGSRITPHKIEWAPTDPLPIGLDLEGFLLGLASRLPIPEQPTLCSCIIRAGLDGWLAAFQCTNQVHFYGLSGGKRLPPDIVLHLLWTPLASRSTRQPFPTELGAVEAPPTWWFQSIRQELLEHQLEQWWSGLEPPATSQFPGALRRLLVGVERQMYRAYQQGRLQELTDGNQGLIRLSRLGASVRSRLNETLDWGIGGTGDQSDPDLAEADWTCQDPGLSILHLLGWARLV
ncbi:MAG: DEAD/DEAH box helicase [Bradymonadales bacterium]|nr:DEAD/DEAH box helicase [Bradymonadales bacterium]